MKKLSLVIACVGFISAATFAQGVKKQAAPAPQVPAAQVKQAPESTPVPMTKSMPETPAPVSRTETSAQPQKIEGLKVMKRPAVMVPTKRVEAAQPVQPLNKK